VKDFYVNGAVTNSGISSIASVPQSSYKAGIGSRHMDGNWAYPFNGLIDDVRIYNYARTADQVRADYNAGAALYLGQ